MKAAPVVEASLELGDEPILVHTGQHYDAVMSDVFFDQLGLPRPDLNLGVGSGSHAVQTAALMTAVEETLVHRPPPAIVVYGDINSTAAAVLVAAKLGIPSAHVEAGLRSFDRSMPEEINRVVTDALCDLHFATSPEAIAHLAREGIDAQRIHFVGNPMIDTLLKFRDALEIDGTRRRHGLGERYGVVTLHRPSNVDRLDTAERIVTALHQIADEVDLIVPLHPRGREILEVAGLGRHPSIAVSEPLGYLEFMALVAGATIVLTDSGGIQEETTVLGIPCVTLRQNTERPITLSMGTNSLAGTDPDLIVRRAKEKIESEVLPEQPPLWDGRAGARIAAILHDWNFDTVDSDGSPI